MQAKRAVKCTLLPAPHCLTLPHSAYAHLCMLPSPPSPLYLPLSAFPLCLPSMPSPLCLPLSAFPSLPSPLCLPSLCLPLSAFLSLPSPLCLPSLPSLSAFPSLPSPLCLPSLPSLSAFPLCLSSLPSLSAFPSLPSLSAFPLCLPSLPSRLCLPVSAFPSLPFSLLSLTSHYAAASPCTSTPSLPLFPSLLSHPAGLPACHSFPVSLPPIPGMSPASLSPKRAHTALVPHAAS
ncbi:unnamed protein product [Closterium sp. Yama58-4]|nr:unnamed protein product [Closterium sp. Yama58-4]